MIETKAVEIVEPPESTAVPRDHGRSRRSNLAKYVSIVTQLAIVDFRMKYHDSVLGYFWSMLNPLTQFAVYYFVFTYLFVSPVPKFTLYLLTGVFFWNFFADATFSAIPAVQGRAALTKKIYFPRYLIVFASTLTALISFAINTVLLVILVIVFDHSSSLQLLTILPFCLLTLLATGLGFIVSILFVQFRDISQIWGVCLNVGFWLTPILYNPLYVPAPLARVALANPVGRIMVMLRAFLVFDNWPPPAFILTTVLFCIAVFVFGFWLFRKFEHRIPEYL